MVQIAGNVKLVVKSKEPDIAAFQEHGGHEPVSLHLTFKLKK